jgi:hypothetical protein
MKFSRRTRFLAVGAVACGVAIALGNLMDFRSLRAQDARKLKEESSVESGRVKSLLKNDRDDVDGLLLENGLRIHFPPHAGKRIADVVRVGDTVRMEGVQKMAPDGEKVFELTRLESGKEAIQIERPGPDRGPGVGPGPGPRGPRDEEPMNVEGLVTEYARNPRGDIDGLILKDGTVVRFPPHQSREIQELIALGDTVTIQGRRHVTPRGENILHADRIEAHGKTIEREGPKRGPEKPKGGPNAPGREGPTNADLMRELKAIRQLLEKQSRP